MKQTLLSIFILCFLISATPVLAEDTAPATQPSQTITLKDGTVLKGHLSKVANDMYIIQTEHMGQVQVNVADLKSIATGDVAPTQNPSPLAPMTGNPTGNLMGGMLGQGGQLQQQLLADPEIQASIQELLKDPQALNLFTNGNLMQDALSMDPAKIQNNQSVKELMQNPKMQEIIQKINQKISGQTQTTSSPAIIPNQ